jgi:hypothetical protein
LLVSCSLLGLEVDDEWVLASTQRRSIGLLETLAAVVGVLVLSLTPSLSTIV